MKIILIHRRKGIDRVISTDHESVCVSQARMLSVGTVWCTHAKSQA